MKDMDTSIIITSMPSGEDVAYEPWTDGYAVGFKITCGERVEYIYLNPSNTDDGEDSPNVFLYHGADGDPSSDAPIHFYNVLEEQGSTTAT